jgi:aryl-alcohol dehydrogenase-like predicted oxidoreductase
MPDPSEPLVKTTTIAGVSKPISRLVLGTMIINTKEKDKSFQLLDDAFSLGCTTLDCAHVYGGGDSERAVGRWMQERKNREQVVILTKGAHPNGDRKRVTPFDITADLMDSLARLKTGYIDIYLLHRDDLDVPVGPIVDILNEHKRAGRIRTFGGSNWTHQRIAEANDYAQKKGIEGFSSSSPNYTLAEQVADPWGENSGSITIGGPGEAPARAWYRKTNMPIFAWSSLARGFFSGRITRENFEKEKVNVDGACQKAYCHEVNFKRLDRVQILAKQKNLTVPQIAMAYILSQPLNVMACVGAATKAEFEANVNASKLTLTPEESAWLNLESDQPAFLTSLRDSM